MLIQWKKYWEGDVEFTINEESDYYEENTSDNEDFFSTISVRVWTEKTCGNKSHEKETKHIYASAANLLHIRIGNLNGWKCRHCKNEPSEIDPLCCRE